MTTQKSLTYFERLVLAAISAGKTPEHAVECASQTVEAIKRYRYMEELEASKAREQSRKKVERRTGTRVQVPS